MLRALLTKLTTPAMRAALVIEAPLVFGRFLNQLLNQALGQKPGQTLQINIDRVGDDELNFVIVEAAFSRTTTSIGVGDHETKATFG